MRSRARAAAFVLIAALVGVVGPVSAQPADPVVPAEDLFQRAKSLMTNKQYAEACPLFAESYRLDRAGGTLQNLAVCYEALGKWASAYSRFQELRAVSMSAVPPRPDRVKLAEEHIASMTPRLSHVVFAMPPDLPAGMVLKVDDVTYEKASWSAGILVDPGAHVVLLTAPGRVPFRTTVVIGSEGKEAKVSVPILASSGAPPPPHDVSNPPPTTNGGRTLGFIVGGVGLASLAAGGVFGLLTITTNKAGRDRCSSSTNASASPADFDPVTGRCFQGSPAWKDANAKKDEARTFANVANVLVPVGLVGLGVGAILVWHSSGTTAASQPSTARVVPSLGGASLEGTF